MRLFRLDRVSNTLNMARCLFRYGHSAVSLEFSAQFGGRVKKLLNFSSRLNFGREKNFKTQTKCTISKLIREKMIILILNLLNGLVASNGLLITGPVEPRRLSSGASGIECDEYAVNALSDACQNLKIIWLIHLAFRRTSDWYGRQPLW